ncbi:MAG TPA: BatA domain-containing protein [Planctomycetota bacterium]|nr:BatA domain-containing protein [Planctomycetota bacterium]
MLALAFLNPMLLWALPLCAVPIVIHLLNRRRFQRVPWAAIEFLLAAMKRNRKRLRMEQWLVLLLRTLAVLFLVSLVSRPQLGGGGLLGSRTHHVVVLDDSASMTQRMGSTVLFAKAQDRIRALADDLGKHRNGDLLSIVRTSRASQPDLWAQRVGPDVGRRVGTMLKEWVVGDGAWDLGGVLQATVVRAATVQDAARTEYYIVGDSRACDWTTDDDKAKPAVLTALGAMRADEEHLAVIGVGGQQSNVAVVDVRLVDRTAVVGVPTTLAVDVQNLGLDPIPATSVAVEVDGQSRITQVVPPLAPGERLALPIGHTFHQSGYHHIDAQLEATESYPLDDRRTLALDVREKSRVLLVDGQPDEDEGETFFLQAALDPGGEAVSGIEAQVVTDVTLEETDLEPFDMVWLCNVQSPTAATTKRLEGFVAAGGGLVIACGAMVDSGRYDELMWHDGKGLLPLAIGDVAGDPARPERAVLVNRDHPVCGKLGEILDLLVGNVLLVKRWLTLVEDARSDASVVARIHDAEGPPLLVTRPYGTGGGEVVLLAVTTDKFWSNLPSTDLFLVLANQIHRFAARRRDPSGHNLTTGGVYRLELDPGVYRADVTVRSRDGEGDERTFSAVESAGKPGEPAAAGAPQAPMVLDLPMFELRQTGAYEVELLRHDGAPERRMLARNPPISESRLVAFSDAAFARLYPPELQSRVTFVRDDSGLGASGDKGELWHLLAAALLVGLLAESLLAWRFGRR